MRSGVLYLATDAYGGRGGIALYNRDVIDAMLRLPDLAPLKVIPRIAGNGAHAVPAEIDWREQAGKSSSHFVAECARAALQRPKPALIYCAHVNLLPFAAALKLATGARLLLAIYGVEAWEPFRRTSSRRALSAVDHLLSISRYTADEFCKWSGWQPENVTIVPNAIRLEDFGPGPRHPDLERRYGLEGRKAVLLFGRMDPSERRKGFDELLEAWSAIRDQRPATRLLLAGDGGDIHRLQAKAKDLGIAEEVVFTGFMPESEKADLYRLADAYVMPSTQEGFGFVHLEAMASGVPAVASKRDGAREAVRDGLIGALVDPFDRDEIIRETLKALDRPKSVPPGLAYFAFDGFVERLEACVRQTLSGHAG
jgi:glycosyltransferase involved in cell wall biosynthesis